MIAFLRLLSNNTVAQKWQALGTVPVQSQHSTVILSFLKEMTWSNIIIKLATPTAPSTLNFSKGNNDQSPITIDCQMTNVFIISNVQCPLSNV